MSIGNRGMGREGGVSDDDDGRGLSDSDHDKGEVGGGHFLKGPWLSLCSAVDAPIPEDGASDAKGDWDTEGF